LNTSVIKKRFEELISLNIEGIASTEENLELLKILRQHSNLKTEFIQTRNIHYLLKVHCDPSASEMAFVNRFKGAPRSRRRKETGFLGSVQNRLFKVAQKKKKRQFTYQTLKIAASILIIVGGAVLLKNQFFHTQTHLPQVSKSDETYLDWNYEPEIAALKNSIAMLDVAPPPTTYLYAGTKNEIIKEREKIHEMINRNERLWP
jgi:hypothetical protein